eukprot:TRINITY_DN11901_c0_g1_i1.p1 TRINITY_DN11901_c0_g1~~TRINITY_DN11901_c0_g1_i1.p1  ORF type:complete len:372 (+),score=64.18 TRINITY_DN11901_c0_g1_i1:116-1117(+)
MKMRSNDIWNVAKIKMRDLIKRHFSLPENKMIMHEGHMGIKSSTKKYSNKSLKKKYKLEKELGRGSFSIVYTMIVKKNKDRIALKIVPNNEDSEVLCLNEIFILQKMTHLPKITTYLRHFYVDNQIWIFFEQINGGTLEEAIKKHKFSLLHMGYIMSEILGVVADLHALDFIHGDLNSSNIMLDIDTGSVKLVDFKYSQNVSNVPLATTIGTDFWMAPELIQHEEYSFSVDIWSIGVLLIEMLTGHPPYHESWFLCMYKVGTEGLLPYIESDLKDIAMSEDCENFLKYCLGYDPIQRQSIDPLLYHPFVQQNNMKKGFIQSLINIFFVLDEFM